MPFIVKDLLDGRPQPLFVTMSDSVQQAIELMLEHDYTQLPVIDGNERPPGGPERLCGQRGEAYETLR